MEAANTIKLQGIGTHHAKLVSDVRIGDILVWNCGALTEVVQIVRLSAKYVNVVQRCPAVGYHSRRMKLDRLETLERQKREAMELDALRAAWRAEQER